MSHRGPVAVLHGSDPDLSISRASLFCRCRETSCVCSRSQENNIEGYGKAALSRGLLGGCHPFYRMLANRPLQKAASEFHKVSPLLSLCLMDFVSCLPE